jgi:prepilin-type N-terminal cleavage/methylation domain-containing protein
VIVTTPNTLFFSPRSPIEAARRVRARRGGFTLLELLIAMAMFSILGIAVVALLGQGMSIFVDGTADTSMQDRLQAILPAIRADFAAIQPASSPEVLPPPPLDMPSADVVTPPTPASTGPAIRLWSGPLKLTDLPPEWPLAYCVAFVRTNAREGEDPITRYAGSAPSSSGAPLKSYDPSTVDSGSASNLFATGGLMEEVWVAVPEDPAPERRNGPPGTDSSTWSRSVMALYRLFRAPVGEKKSLLVRENINSLEKIRKAGRVMHEGVLYFGVTWRNAFSKSWTDGIGTGKVSDGQAYVGSIWDSTRGIDKDFAFFRGPDSLGDVRDDVFPQWARIEVTLAVEGTLGFGRGETTLADSATAGEKRVRLESLDPLYKPAGAERWFKVGTEWMSTTLSGIDATDHHVTVARGQRGTAAVDHAAGEQVFVGATVSTEVPLVYKDRYTAKRR